MSSVFSISHASSAGLGTRILEGKCIVDKDLALVQKSGRWTLIDTSKEKLPSEGNIIRGADLAVLMKAAANGEKTTPSSINDKEYRVLTTNSKFRTLCRLVPGFETSEHSKSRAHTADAVQYVYEKAKMIGKGLNEIEKKQLIGQFVGTEGRYVGQDQDHQNYWIREIVFLGSNKTTAEIEILVNAWRADESAMLSIKDWEIAKKTEWQKNGLKQDFLPWLAEEAWNNKQKKAWQKENPRKSFNEHDFKAWKATQEDPVLGPALWELKDMSRAKTDEEFQTWRTNAIKIRQERWAEFKETTGAVNISFYDFEHLDTEYHHSGAIDNPDRWILKQLWSREKDNGTTTDDLNTYIQKLQYSQEIALGRTTANFPDWIVAKDKELHDRHQGTNLPLSFDEWRAQQDEDIFTEPAPFILLGEKERAIYETTCHDGVLERNGKPYDTSYEKTLHSGKGYAIFVIDPQEKLYSGSHIGGVFHHSSFLNEGAIIAAGELKTNPEGKVMELSSKSGHYRPTNEQNRYMLQYFLNRGVDLSSIDFKFYDANGDTKTYNAQAYLDELEHIKNLGQIDIS